MAKNPKDVKINGSPYHSEIRRFEGGFRWDFTVDSNLSGARRKIISLKFERWWLVYLAQELEKVLEEEEAEIRRIRQLSGFVKNDEQD